MTAASTSARLDPARPGTETLDRRLSSAARAASPEAPRLVSVAAPVAPLFAPLPDDETRVALWAPPEGPRRVSWGGWTEVARSNELTAPAEALARLSRVVPEGPGPEPVLLGGFAFERGTRAEGWSPLGVARWTLPAFTYVVDGDRAWLQVLLTGQASEPAAEVAAALERLRTPVAPTIPRFSVADDGDRAAWTSAIAAAQARMAAGTLDKAVLSRRIRLAAEAAPRSRALVAALLARADDAPVTRFLFAEAGGAFVGATPERLVRLRGRRVETEALAGSRPGREDPETLFTDAKEREEHAYVVEHLAAALRGLGATPVHADRPELRRLGYVTHLRTPMQAELPKRLGVFEVADALHPTPAVGGAPLAPALEVIRDGEPDARGWYAGAVGWVNAAGEGDLWVALRSARIDGAGGAAYVGAGIVAGSDPDREWAETQAKAEAMLGALGVGR